MEHPVEVDLPASLIFDPKNVKGNLKVDIRGIEQRIVYVFENHEFSSFFLFLFLHDSLLSLLFLSVSF